MIVTTELVRYDTAKKALMEAKNFDEVKEIHDRAAALEAYARQAKDTEMIQWATEIKIRAERKAGEMLRNAKAAGTVATPGKQTVNLKHQRWSNETTTDNTHLGLIPRFSSSSSHQLNSFSCFFVKSSSSLSASAK